MNPSAKNNSTDPALPAEEILQAVQGIRFGLVEVVVHDSRVTEIRQMRRIRIGVSDQEKFTTYPTKGGLPNNPASATSQEERPVF